MKLHWMPFAAGTAMWMALGLASGEAGAWTSFSTNGSNRCAQCHTTFGGPGETLHDSHTPLVTNDCATCHTGTPGQNDVDLASSTGGDGLDAISCMGCHGRAEDNGQPNSDGYGAGLRAHHSDAGNNACDNCHATELNNYTPVGENVLPPYYADPGNGHPNIPTDACADGLDNDGDNSTDGTDANDPDCQGVGGGGTGGAGGSGGAGTGGEAPGGAGGTTSSGTGGTTSSGTGGTTSSGTGGTTSSGTGGTTSSGTGGTTSSSSGDEDDAEDDDGCGCRVVAPSETPLAAPTLGLLGLGLLLARRRRR
jgi:MYXO-CTERM domain-containing protein